MSEATSELKSLIESLLTRFDESKLASDKHLEAQLAFNTQVSTDLAHLRKQLDLKQADIDEVRNHRDPPFSTAARQRQQAPAPQEGEPQGSSMTSLAQPNRLSHHGMTARLANTGPPLLPSRPLPLFAGATTAVAIGLSS